MPARPMAEVTQEPEPQRPIAGPQQMQEKGIGQGRQGQELQALLDAPQSRTLKGQFTFVIPPGQFDLPSPPIRKPHTPTALTPPPGPTSQPKPAGPPHPP